MSGDRPAIAVDSNSADVISNYATELAPDKDAVLREAYRVLRPGGRLIISDTVMECTLKIDPENLSVQEQCVTRNDSWAECVGEALPEDEYLDLIKRIGFVDIDVKRKTQSFRSQGKASITVTATKPVEVEDISPKRQELLGPTISVTLQK